MELNDEYLWNKKGEDAEIEKLETELSQFRGRSDFAGLSLPVSRIEETRSRGMFAALRAWRLWQPVGFAGAVFAFVTAMLWIGGGIGGGIGGRSVPSPDLEAIANEPAASLSRPSVPSDGFVSDGSVENITKVRTERFQKTSRPSSVARVVPTTPVRSGAPSRTVKLPAKRAEKENSTLTPEERFAYNQLLIALSVTGSKLRIVRDTVNREDEKPAATKLR